MPELSVFSCSMTELSFSAIKQTTATKEVSAKVCLHISCSSMPVHLVSAAPAIPNTGTQRFLLLMPQRFPCQGKLPRPCLSRPKGSRFKCQKSSLPLPEVPVI
ncbi:hypothetical protein QQF64_022522 [Cirrhinus molitorella]|uniref:Uncharacterized protein n=1 Tax=Cirrhinus molitorella TaxID=172907 RepID=A0ABR3L2K5_9TELE